MAQAMFKRKALVSGKVEEEVDDTRRQPNANLLTTMYPLNNSWTKKIIVGMHYNVEQKVFQPLIQLLNNQYTQGLHISRASWSDIQNNFAEIDEYFDSQDCRQYNSFNSLKLNDIDVFFTTSFGTKSVVFDKSKNIAGENSSKRRKTCPPTVVMQKRTFQGMKRTVTCVDERFYRLDRISSDVNKCKEFIKSELSVLLEEPIFLKKDADLIVRIALKENAIQIEEKLKKLFDNTKDAVFLEHYFPIVYLELITINYDVFIFELASEISAKSVPNVEKVMSVVM